MSEGAIDVVSVKFLKETSSQLEGALNEKWHLIARKHCCRAALFALRCRAIDGKLCCALRLNNVFLVLEIVAERVSAL